MKFMDNDFNGKKKYPQFTPDIYLKQVHYPESGVTWLEPQQWAVGLAHLGLLNMLNVLRFGISTGSTACARQLLMLVDNGCMCMGKKIPST